MMSEINNAGMDNEIDEKNVIFQQNTSQNIGINKYNIGQLICVEKRCWPGINKPGGTGRIKKITDLMYTVSYVLG